MSKKILPRFNLPNQRGKKTHCDICTIKFQILVKHDHQCKRCLRVICQQCGPQRRNVYDTDGSVAPHRCCLVCIKEIQEIGEYKLKHKLCFGQDSEFVSEWINKINKEKISYDQILNEYSDSITSITNENTIRFKRESQIIMRDLSEAFNYSLRHFIREITRGVSTIMIETKLKNVTLGIFARMKNLPYIPQLIYLSAFFLCFANQAHSYFIITRMIQKIYPQYVRVNKMQKDNLLASTLKTMLEMYRICVGKVDRNELEIIAQYMESRFSLYVLSFTLNLTSLPCSLFIISQMLKTGSSVPFLKGIAAMVSLCREDVASSKDFSEVEISVLRTVSGQKIRNCFIQFEKSDVKFEVTNQIFDSVEHRKLHEKYKQLESLYTKSEKSLNDKQSKIKQMVAELALKKRQCEIEVEKSRKLQSDIIKLSTSLPKLLKYQEMHQLYEITMTRNQELQEKYRQLKKVNEKYEKERLVDQKMRRNWAKMEEEYNQEIVKLKTKTEIMQIQVSAKQIDFNTSFIQRKFEQKNVEINMLNAEFAHLKTQLQFYKTKLTQKSSSRNQKQQKMSYQGEKERQKQFERHIQNSQQLVQSLSTELTQVTKQLNEAKILIQDLSTKNKKLEQQIMKSDDIRQIIEEIPEEYNYAQSLQQIERLIEKENNFIKKKTMESIRESLNKCYRELRFRNIDCRIKEEKIKNSFLINLLNPDITKNLPIMEQQQKNNDKMLQILQNIDKNKIDETNKECQIM